MKIYCAASVCWTLCFVYLVLFFSMGETFVFPLLQRRKLRFTKISPLPQATQQESQAPRIQVQICLIPKFLPTKAGVSHGNFSDSNFSFRRKTFLTFPIILQAQC